ncbi:conjugal transfer protein TraF [Deferribacter abyssi]|uniref:conjugal transfer protein TraF n=1 Tax=Deferribacter abyssi TaxID=213806 RepID=UPI003C2AA027
MRSIFSLIIIMLFFPLIVFSAKWQIVGPRALGMGGAYVAVVNDSTAAYWNPAAFGFYKKKEVKRYQNRDFGLGIGAGAGYSIHNDLGEKIDNILDYDYEGVSNDINTDGSLSITKLNDYVKLISELNKITEKDSVIFKANGFIASRIGNFGIGVFALGNIAATPLLDLKNINVDNNSNNIITELSNIGGDNTLDVLSNDQYNSLVNTISNLPGWDSTTAQNFVYAIDDTLKNNGISTVTNDTIDAVITTAEVAANAQTGGTYDQNDSKIRFKGLIYFEVPLSYGYAFNKNFAIGGNVKFMKGRYYESYVSLYDNNNDNDLFDKAKDNYEESTTFGVDLGAMYKIGNTITLGIVGRNLNTPKFDKPSGGDYELDPQARAGIAITPFSWLTLAADIDLTKNETNIKDYDSQNISIGAEIELLKFLALRAGYYKNLAENDIDNVYTAGLGLNFYLFRLDAGIAFSDKTTTIDGKDLPNEIKAEVALSFEF